MKKILYENLSIQLPDYLQEMTDFFAFFTIFI